MAIHHSLTEKAAFQGIAHRPRFSKAPSTKGPEGVSLPSPEGPFTPFVAFDGYLTWEVPGYPVGMVEIPQDEEDEAAEFLDREAWNRECAA